MLIRILEDCDEIVTGDHSLLKELFNPSKDEIKTGYSLAHAKVLPGETTLAHKLKSSEVYYILEGSGTMFVDDERGEISEGQAVYIPPGAVQKIENTGVTDLKFLCIVDPAWKPEDEELI